MDSWCAESSKTMFEGLKRARSNFGPITRDKENVDIRKSGESYKYVSLDSILRAIAKPLEDEGLYLTHRFDVRDGSGLMTTSLCHPESGHALHSTLPVNMSGDMQALGTSITYLRRYSIVALLSLAVDEDTDASESRGKRIASNAALKPKPKKEITVLERGRAAMFGAKDFHELITKINGVGENKKLFASENEFEEVMGIAQMRANAFNEAERKVILGTIDQYLGQSNGEEIT